MSDKYIPVETLWFNEPIQIKTLSGKITSFYASENDPIRIFIGRQKEVWESGKKK